MPKYLMSWELPVPESILGTMRLCSTVYPDAVRYNLKDEIKDFYQKFYRINLSDQDVDNLLQDKSKVVLNKPSSS